MPAPNLHSEDYYAILGCDRNADDATLKKAYRKLAVKVSTYCHMYWYMYILYCSTIHCGVIFIDIFENDGALAEIDIQNPVVEIKNVSWGSPFIQKWITYIPIII